MRERVAGLERLTTELSEERNAWREQAARSEESARELHILVQQAQALAQALPAGESSNHEVGTASPMPPGREQEIESTPACGDNGDSGNIDRVAVCLWN